MIVFLCLDRVLGKTQFAWFEVIFSEYKKGHFREYFYAIFLDSSFRSKMALVEVDLMMEKVIKWEILSNFDDRPEFQSNKMYNFGDLNNYLKDRFPSKGNSFTGGMVLCLSNKSTLILLGTAKKFDKINSNNSELNFIFYINYSNFEWSAVLKTENHSYEQSGQVLKFSKVYLSQGWFCPV